MGAALIRRVLSILVAVLSALVCVGWIAWGIRSFQVVDTLQFIRRDGSGWVMVPKNGRLSVLVFIKSQLDPGFLHIRGSPQVVRGTDYGRRILGFGGGIAPSGARFVTVPFWFLAVVFGAPPALVARAAWRRRAIHPGHCRRCGYDLRASPERCPECGAESRDAGFPAA